MGRRGELDQNPLNVDIRPTEHELEMARSAANGVSYDPYSGKAAGERFKISTTAIARLLVGDVKWFADDAIKSIHSRGLSLHRAIISEDIDLVASRLLYPLILVDCRLGAFKADYAEFHGAVILQKCNLSGALELRGSKMARLELVDCEIDRVRADQMDVRELIELRNCKISSGLEFRGIRAARLRILKGTHVHAERRNDAENPSIRINHAEIRNEAEFRNCTIEGGITMKDARFACLEFDKLDITEIPEQVGKLRCGILADRIKTIGSVFLDTCDLGIGTIRLPGAEIGRQLRIRGVKAGADDQGRSLVLRNVNVQGELKVEDRMMGADPARTKLQGMIELVDGTTGRVTLKNTTAGSLKAAGLTVRVGCELGPDLIIRNEVELDGSTLGSVTVKSASIGRNLTTLSLPSFSLRNASVGGSLQMGEGVKIWSTVDLEHARIGGDLTISGVRSTGEKRRSWTDGPDSYGSGGETVVRGGPDSTAILADFLRLRGTMRIDEVDVDGSVHLENAKLGRLCLARSRIGADHETAFNANRIEIKGAAVFGPDLQVRGPVLIEDAKLGHIDVCADIGPMEDRGKLGECACTTACNCNYADGYALSLGRTRILSDVSFAEPTTIGGAVSLFDAKIGGSLYLRFPRIGGRDRFGVSIYAPHVDITGDTLIGSPSDGIFSSPGSIVFTGSRVGGKFTISAARIGASKLGYSLDARYLNVTRDFEISGNQNRLICDGAITIRSSSIGELLIYRADVNSPQIREGSERAALDAYSLKSMGVADLRDITIKGTVEFTQATMTELTIKDCSINSDNLSCLALDCRRIGMTGHLDLSGLKAFGRIWIESADVGELSLEGSRVNSGCADYENSLRNEMWNFSIGIYAVTVRGDLNLDGLKTSHSVALAHSDIRKRLLMSDVGGIRGRLYLAGTKAAVLDDTPRHSRPVQIRK